MFVPYVSVLFGSLAYSLYFKKKSEKSGDAIHKKFSKDLIDFITYNKGIAFALGIIPLLSSVFGYAQLLNKSGLNVPEFLLISLIVLIVSVFFIYTYKYTFHLKDIFNFAGKNTKAGDSEQDINEDLASYTEKTGTLHRKSGQYGFILLLISVYLYGGSVELAADTARWESGNDILGVIFSIPAVLAFLQFISGAFALTSVVLLYIYFRPNSEVKIYDEKYGAFIKKFTLRNGLVATALFPVIFVISLSVRPINSLSYEFFITVIAVLILLLFSAGLFYLMLKEVNVKHVSALTYVMLLIIMLMVIKDQFAFNTSTKFQTALLSRDYGMHEQKMMEEMGISAPVSGADIYNGRCIACHSFDRKIVGPAYNQTLPKYEGKKELLVKYILNPVKINPEYPAMPNQGLKPQEAEAVVEYLLTTYKKK
ncbi:MAG: hypothetical protein CVV24_13650 [Ignavibacteriae bacterium HGW-Ignavibacteriae-3]|nr:MAG: hypothetical protein CVV24_13650 [Ignavibacteriae bacterium HGW-Ignavibacteriae-3]